MKVLVAIDSFKGSLTSLQAGNAAAEGVRLAHPGAETVVFPVADGGEGTVDALIAGLGGEKLQAQACDPLGRKISCTYGKAGKVAVMEMSAAAGSRERDSAGLAGGGKRGWGFEPGAVAGLALGRAGSAGLSGGRLGRRPRSWPYGGGDIWSVGLWGC